VEGSEKRRKKVRELVSIYARTGESISKDQEEKKH
jgi:hypothetical protein